MNELQIIQNNEELQVDGRQLHMFLEVNSNYTTWFNRMCEYGFEEGKDFTTCFPNMESENHGGQNKINHLLSISMAKEIAMIQRNEKGKLARQYFIKIENEWNSPEKVMARALLISNKQIKFLESEVLGLNKAIAEMKPKADYVDTILHNKSLVPITHIAKDYGMSAQGFNKMLHDLGIQYKCGKQWVLYGKYQACGYTHSKQYPELTNSKGEPITNMEWTQKGRLFLYNFLKEKRNLVPVIEREEPARI